MTGQEVLELISIMDRLRSPGGCPWDAEQTHESLLEYLLEETHEFIAAVESRDEAEMVEELGDLLLQVVFHARIGQEHGWDIDDVARGISEKLIRRHPHVFAAEAGEVLSAEDVAQNWTRRKAAEKQRTSALDGIPRSLPALSQAQKTWRRARESGLELSGAGVPSEPDDASALGEQLLALVTLAEARGWDAEAALRQQINDLRTRIVTLEASRDPDADLEHGSG